VRKALENYQKHLAAGRSETPFDITPLKLRLVSFSKFDRLLKQGSFSGIYDNVVIGTSKGESLVGTDNRDLIVGLGGNDTINGRGQDDILVGGPGNDSLQGDAGNDTMLFSGSGDGLDWLSGGAGTDSAVGTAVGTVIGVDGYSNGVEKFVGTGDTIVRDSSSAHRLDFSRTELSGIAELDAAAGNDTIVASDLSAGRYRGGEGNDTLIAGGANATWLFAGASSGIDLFQGNGSSAVVAVAETAGTIIGIDGYSNGVDTVQGFSTGDTIVRDSYYGRTLDFSRTLLTNIAEVDAGSGNDTVIASDLGPGRYRGGEGNDSLTAGAAATTWLYAGASSGSDQFQGNGASSVVALAATAGTIIGIDGYSNGVDAIQGFSTGDTIVRDSYYGRTLDFSRTLLTNIAEVDAGAGNDTVIASDLGPGRYRGGEGNDTLTAGAA
ncbi:MAG TPA: calcium-binding protein, partial [Pirellulaceae bacterium]|nr:calcium-binding protein [Pirellulaceae bacterium]